jgi:RNA polymerase sigma-70 factor (ECF subfamily)
MAFRRDSSRVAFCFRQKAESPVLANDLPDQVKQDFTDRPPFGRTKAISVNLKEGFGVCQNITILAFIKPIIVIGKALKSDLKNGVPGAFRELFRLLYPRMKGYGALFIADNEQVNDIIQECFITLWEKRQTIDPEKQVESLLFVILRNRCLNHLKEKRLREGDIDFQRMEVNELQYLYQLDFSEKEEKSLEEQLIIAFNDAVDTLPPKMKQVFLLCKIEGRKQKEVAEELGITQKAVEKHIASAKQHISNRLTKQYPLLTVLISLWLS